MNGLYKTELVRGPGQGPWRTVEDVELATLNWVHWYSSARLHEYLGYVPPAEVEATWREKQAPSCPESPAKDAGATVRADSAPEMAVGIKG